MHNPDRLLIDIDVAYRMISREFYEPLDRYVPVREELIDLVDAQLPRTWRALRHDIWYHCAPADAALPAQGWKVHVSARLEEAPAILAKTAGVAIARGTAFKFAVDVAMLSLVNGKRWSRSGSGKFVTLYPRDEVDFVELLEALRLALKGHTGPYVLSDRRYRDSSVVFYRFGGILPRPRVDVRGLRSYQLTFPDGSVGPDTRAPFFVLPPGVVDPLHGAEDDRSSAGDAALKGGRYAVQSALAFSSAGGVYLAVDRDTGHSVVIKEARPHILVGRLESTVLLEKEYRLLRRLEGAGVAPMAIDFFTDWEHSYLVEEHLEGVTLRAFVAGQALALRTNPTAADARAYYARYREVCAEICQVFDALHARGIAFGDVSHHNVMVLGDGCHVRLIDFEGATELGVNAAMAIRTPGFSPASAPDTGDADDRYGIGGLMLAGVMPITSLLALDDAAGDRMLDSWVRNLAYPSPVAGAARGLLRQDPAQRSTLAETVQVLRQESDLRAPVRDDCDVTPARAADIVRRIGRHLDAVMTPGRLDRLFPADPAVFETNPLSIAWGACGVALALRRMRGRVSPVVTNWIMDRLRSHGDSLPAGLYVGRAGVAWTLLELGMRDEAEALCARDTADACEGCPDVFYGLAGWGMTQLRLFEATADDRYLHRARQAARAIVDRHTEPAPGLWAWPSLGSISCGFAHGACGISVFLLYLYTLTRDEATLSAGRAGLAFALSRAVPLDGALTWHLDEDSRTVVPYWRWGSAGVAMALLRYYAVTHDSDFLRPLDAVLLDVRRKYTIFPGRFFGLAGLGEACLDLRCLDTPTADAAASSHARTVMSGLRLFEIERDGGTAFPGETLQRLSCDFGTGSAGIGLFMQRFLDRGPAPLMLDHLLVRDGAAALA